MAIPSITGVGRVSATSADTSPHSGAAARQPQAPAVEVDEITQQPLPPRVPWLSRLSLELEAAARQRPAFPSAPLLGDHIDRSA